MSKAKLILGAALLLPLALVVANTYRAENRARDFRADVADPSRPPTLSAAQRDSRFTVGTWIGVERKASDCQTADEYMDRNIASRTVTQRGQSRTHYLADYVSSCAGVFDSMVNLIRPQAAKWCAYRSTDARLETLCQDWETNLPAYRARFDQVNGPTLRRYEQIKLDLEAVP